MTKKISVPKLPEHESITAKIGRLFLWRPDIAKAYEEAAKESASSAEESSQEALEAEKSSAEFAAAAAGSASAASNSASIAEQNAQKSAQSETKAQEFSQNSANSANNASNFASAASNSANLAAASAVKAEQSAVKTQQNEELLKGYVDDAALFAEKAEDAKNKVETIETDLQDAIEKATTFADKIPEAASATNKLADRDFVNSSIATATAEFKGTYNSIEELESVGADKNDYAFVREVDQAGNVLFNKYKWSETGWLWEYTLNNSSFTAAQWAAINSQITETLRKSYDNHLQNTTQHITESERSKWNSKQDKLTAGNGISITNENIIEMGDIDCGGLFD